MGYISLCWACPMASEKNFNGFNHIRTIRAFKGHVEHTSHFMDEENGDPRRMCPVWVWVDLSQGTLDIQISTVSTDYVRNRFTAAFPKESTGGYVLELHKTKNNFLTNNFSDPLISYLIQKIYKNGMFYMTILNKMESIFPTIQILLFL